MRNPVGCGLRYGRVPGGRLGAKCKRLLSHGSPPCLWATSIFRSPPPTLFQCPYTNCGTFQAGRPSCFNRPKQRTRGMDPAGSCSFVPSGQIWRGVSTIGAPRMLGTTLTDKCDPQLDNRVDRPFVEAVVFFTSRGSECRLDKVRH